MIKDKLKKIAMWYFKLPRAITYSISVAIATVISYLITRLETGDFNLKNFVAFIAATITATITSILIHLLRLLKSKLEE